jgi:hypothetical protein
MQRVKVRPKCANLPTIEYCKGFGIVFFVNHRYKISDIYYNNTVFLL